MRMAVARARLLSVGGRRSTYSLPRRIGQEVSAKYAEVAAAPLSEGLRRSLGKPWAAHIACKAALFDALTRQHQAQVFIADDECGQQIACLQVQCTMTR